MRFLVVDRWSKALISAMDTISRQMVSRLSIDCRGKKESIDR